MEYLEKCFCFFYDDGYLPINDIFSFLQVDVDQN